MSASPIVIINNANVNAAISTNTSATRDVLGLGAAQAVTFGAINSPSGNFTSTTSAPAVVITVFSANDPGVILKNSTSVELPDGWRVSLGKPSTYDGFLMFGRVGQPLPGDFYFSPTGQANVKGLLLIDGQDGVGSSSSSALAYYKPYTGTRAEVSFRGPNGSNQAEYNFSAYYNDGSWHQVPDILVLRASPAGGRLGVNKADPTEALDIEGNIAASNIKRGTGSPESVVTGSVGDLYTRTDGGAGTTLYVKESGTGNTGWVAK